MTFKLFRGSKYAFWEKYGLAVMLTFLFFFLISIIDKFWISPDEYLYVSIGRSLASAYNGLTCFYCIDTAHTPLLSFLISLGYYFFDIDSIIFYRTISVIFTVATVYIFYKIAEITFKEKKDVNWLFTIFLLFSGFFTFAIRVNVDIVALFFSSVTIYLLLKRVSFWKIGLILALVFLSKEYVTLFLSFVIFIIIIIDALKRSDVCLLDRTKEITFNFLCAFLPFLILMIFFIGFSIFPYPRMLDNMLLELFGSKYSYFDQTVVQTVVQTDIVNLVKEMSFLEKINSIYKSSYRDIDINILVLPLIIVGLISRIKHLYLFFRSDYDLVRKDLIMVLLLFIVSYFNYYVASGDHGFRIIFPVLMSYIYFIYWAFKELFFSRSYWLKFYFAILSFLFIFLYFESNQGILIYNSLLAKNYLMVMFLKYKIIINILIYSFIALFILCYSKIRDKRKNIFFILVLVLVFAYKITPFVVDKSLADRAYGDDYNLMLARPYLEDMEQKSFVTLTNMKPYTYYYYANSIKIPNVDRPDLPIIRKNPEVVYHNRLISTDSLKRDMKINFFCQNRIDYLFYVHTDDMDLLNNYINGLSYLIPIKEYFLSENNRFNWGIYKVDKNFCNS